MDPLLPSKSLQPCRMIQLPKFADSRGNLTVVESARHVPFEIKRVFYLYDIPQGEKRAAHALKTCHQFIIAVSGSLDVATNDGSTEQLFRLDRPDCGLHVPPRIWRELLNFSSDSVCLVLASEFYDVHDYLDEYPDFLRAVRADHK